MCGINVSTYDRFYRLGGVGFCAVPTSYQNGGEIATRLAAVSEMTHAVIQEDLLPPLIIRFNELVDLLRTLRNDRSRTAALYGFDLIVEDAVTFNYDFISEENTFAPETGDGSENSDVSETGEGVEEPQT